MVKKTGNKVASAFGWKFFEKLSVQAGHFIITLILARLLSPDDYGIVAIVMVFVSLATAFVNAGFNTALIQKKKATNDDFISVLFFSLVVATIFYALIYLTSGYLEQFYDMVGLKNIMRVTALTLFPGAINSVQVAYLTKTLQFRVLAECNFVSMILSATIGIIMALAGKGVWALVAQQLATNCISCLFIFIVTKWSPKGRVSFKSLRSMVPFGGKIFISNMMVTLFMNLRSMIIGKIYNSQDLGFFNKGKQFPQTIMESINGTIQSVLLPVYSKKQDDVKAVVNMLRETIRLSHFIIFPMLIGLVTISAPLVRLLLTDKWIMCVPYMQIFAFSYMCQPVQISSAQAFIALGDSKTTLILEFLRKVSEIALIFLSLKHGTLAIAASSLAAGIVAMMISVVANKIKIGYSVRKQILDVAPTLLLSCFMAFVIILVGSFIGNDLLKIIVQIVLGAVVYIVTAMICKMRAFTAIVEVVKSYRK